MYGCPICGGTNPLCPACGRSVSGHAEKSISSFNEFGIQQAPIINRNNQETNFQGYGQSHFSFVENQGFHVTTQIPGMSDTGLDNGLSIHDPVKNMFDNNK